MIRAAIACWLPLFTHCCSRLRRLLCRSLPPTSALSWLPCQAVMNLSMEERGAQPQEPAAGRGNGAAAAGAGRFLTGDLSFFGVRGSC